MAHPDHMLSNYTFDLPQNLVAQRPSASRAESRLMVLSREAGSMQTDFFNTLGTYLPENSLLIANNSKVTPARLFGKRVTGGRVELLLLTPVPLLQSVPCAAPLEDASAGWVCAEAEGLVRASKRLGAGEMVLFDSCLAAFILERGEYGMCRVRLVWQGDLLSIMARLGELPLPPYIKRGDAMENSEDRNTIRTLDATRYQTVYARDDKSGSVAAPTAGLHFTSDLRERLQQAGHTWAEVTLYVGYGTFSPVRTQDIRQHSMHAEYVELSPETAAAVAEAKAAKRPIIAVGTTSARVLEGVWRAQNSAESCAVGKQNFYSERGAPAPHVGWINLFMYPGEEFHVIDGLITNFHLPESSLLMLVAAFAGRKRVLEAYAAAVARKFRFFSYGDAMLIV